MPLTLRYPTGCPGLRATSSSPAGDRHPSATLHWRPRPGNDEHALHGVRCNRPRRRAPADRALPDPAGAWMGRARPDRDRRACRRSDCRLSAIRGPDRPRPGGDRHHESARDHGGLGSRHRPAVAPGDRLAGHPNRRSHCRARTAPRLHPPAHRTSARDLFFRREAAVDPRARRRRPSGSGRRPGAVRHDRHLDHLEPDRRTRTRAARHRCHQCQPHPTDEPAHAAMGRGPAGPVRHSSATAPRDPRLVLPAVLRRHTRPRTRRRCGSDHRQPGRSACGHGGSGLFRTRGGKEHLRHRQFHAAQYRDRARRVHCRPADHAGVRVRRRARRSTRSRDRLP